jgi:hypothetical protein
MKSRSNVDRELLEEAMQLAGTGKITVVVNLAFVVLEHRYN